MIKKNAKKIICFVICCLLVSLAFFLGAYKHSFHEKNYDSFAQFSDSYVNLIRSNDNKVSEIVIDKSHYVCLDDNNIVDAQVLADKLGGSLSVEGDVVELFVGEGRYSFENGSNYLLSDNSAKIMTHKVSVDGDYIGIPIEEVAECMGYVVRVDNNNLCLQDRFASNRLIVKSSRGQLRECGEIASAEGYKDLHILQYKSREDTIRAYEYYQQHNDVSYVDVDSVIQTCEVEDSQVNGIQDSFSYTTWGAEDMGVDVYSEYLLENVGSNNLPEVVVAVLDTGIDTDHEWFSNRIVEGGANYSEVEVTSGYEYEDGFGHGTHVSGIIADLTLNNVKILPIKVMDNQGYGYQSGILLGINKVIELKQQGMNVVAINMSLGSQNGVGSEAQENYIEVIDEAYNAGIITIVSAGNEGSDTSAFTPANVENAITVSAVAKSYDSYYLPSWSNYGSYVDVTAPGQNIESACVGGGTVIQSGTSMASPHVAGAIALLYSDVNAGYSVADVINMLDQTAVDIGTRGWDTKFGEGLVCLEYAYAQLISSVEFSNTTTEITSPFDLSLTCDTAGAVIYYTLDGTLPSINNGQIFTSSLYIESSVEVSAVAYLLEDGIVKGYSKVSTMVYVFSGQDVANAYLVDENGVLLGYTGILTDIIIPDTVGDIEVVGIGEFAFAGTTVQSVRLPSTIRTIGTYAFADCTTLKSVDASNVIEIKDNAFANCSSLTNLNGSCFPMLQKIGRGAFSNCTSIQEINLPSVVFVGNGAFKCDNGNSLVESVVLTNAQYIGDLCFYQYSALTSIEIPNVECLGVLALSRTSLINVSLPSLRYMGVASFSVCQQLESIFLPKVEIIGGESFWQCTSLVTISMEEVEFVGAYAFYGCSSIVSINAPSLTVLGEGVFDSCIELSSISIPMIEIVGRVAFGGCEKLTTIIMPLVQNIDIYAFNGCSGLQSVSISSCIQTIDKLSFNGVSSECQFVVYGGTIAQEIFDELGYVCTVINDNDFSYTIEDNGVIITGYNGVVSESLVIPSIIEDKLVIGIANGAFRHNSYIECVSLPNLLNIGNEAFYGCENLTKISLPKIKTIGNYAFSRCSKLIEVEITSVECVGDKAFFDCSQLKEVEVGANITSLGDSCFGVSSEGVLEDFVIIGFEDSPAYDYAQENNFEFKAKFTNLPYFYYRYYFNDGVQEIMISSIDVLITGSIIIPSSYNGYNITKIGESAFQCCSFITDIYLPDTVKYIDKLAFYYCESLKTINLESVVAIGVEAFANCTMLTTADMPLITNISAGAFYACENLQYVNIPKVVNIGESAFAYCSRLHTVTGNSIENLYSEAFAYASNLQNINVSQVKTLGTVSGDSVFGDVFIDCRKLETLYLPKISSMGRLDIPSLKKVVIGKYFTSATEVLFNTNTVVYCYSGSDAQLCAVESGCEVVIINSARITYNLYSSLQVVKGSPLTINIEVEGFEHQYQWYRVEADGDELIEGENSSSLQIDTSNIGVYKYYTKIIDWEGTALKSNVCSVEVINPPVEEYTVTISVIGGGTLSVDSEVIVDAGEELLIEFIANTGYYLDKVIVDMVELSNIDVNNCRNNGYLFSSVLSNHTITAIFEKCKYKINISVQGDGGYNCTNGLSSIEHGQNRDITITPNEGWKIKEIYINDELIEVVDNKISLTDITEDCSLKLVFEEDLQDDSQATTQVPMSISVIMIGIGCLLVVILLPFVFVIKSSRKHIK